MIAKRAAAVVAGLGLALTLSACSSSKDTTDANAAYCASSATVQSEMAKLKTLVAGNATIEEINDQRKVVADAVEQASQDADDLADEVASDVIAADQAFDDAINDIPEDATLAEARAPYQAAIDAWNASIASIRSDLGC